MVRCSLCLGWGDGLMLSPVNPLVLHFVWRQGVEDLTLSEELSEPIPVQHPKGDAQHDVDVQHDEELPRAWPAAHVDESDSGQDGINETCFAIIDGEQTPHGLR